MRVRGFIVGTEFGARNSKNDRSLGFIAIDFGWHNRNMKVEAAAANRLQLWIVYNCGMMPEGNGYPTL
jgi:hypothetical protein